MTNKPQDETVAERILRALGGVEDYPHQAEHLAFLADGERYEREMEAIRNTEREADKHLHRRIADPPPYGDTNGGDDG